MSLVQLMKTFKCEKCDSSVYSHKNKESIFNCDCGKIILYFSPNLIEFEFKDYVFTIEKYEEKTPYTFRAHQISVESDYGQPIFSTHNENEIIKGINDFITNSIFH